MKNYIKNKIKNFFEIYKIKEDQENLKVLTGNLLSKINLRSEVDDIHQIEFKVFSQFGDDGIIQYIINKLKINDDFQNFIEFGVEDYNESNTRFLLYNNNWSGLIIDSSKKNLDFIKKSNYFWKYDLEAKCEFINADNINSIIKNSNIKKNIGLLSIDLDGNDYWVWKKIDIIDPIIVVIEYNSIFGFEEKISIPYDKDFVRSKAHFSNLYWGASLEAFKYLADKKNYKFICTNSAGNNAYFVKNSHAQNLNINLNKKFYESKFRESRDANGMKNYLTGKEKIKEILDLEVINVESSKKIKIKEVIK